jgi:glucan biosynthesis protein C
MCSPTASTAKKRSNAIFQGRLTQNKCGSTNGHPAESNRIWFLDTLRYLLVVGVVLLHAVEPQMSLENDWAVDDPRTTPLADQTVVFFDVMLMSILFFIAGYFTVPTMLRRGVAGFWRRKLWSLAVPGVLVVIFLNPVWKYVYHLTRAWSAGELPIGYGQAWWLFVTSAKWFELGNIHSFNFTLLHVWFVTLLLLFYVPVTALFPSRFGKTLLAEKATPIAASPGRVLWLLVVTHLVAVTFAAIGILFFDPPLQWMALGPILLFEPVYLPQYIIYFGLGLHAYRRSWFANAKLFGSVKYWLLLFIVSTVAYQSWVQYMFDNPELLSSKAAMIGAWLVRYLVCVSSFVLIVRAGMRFWNSPSRIHRHLAANSYRFYLLHPTVVVLVQLGLLCWTSLGPLAVFMGSILLSLVGTYVVSVGFGDCLAWARAKMSGSADLTTST